MEFQMARSVKELPSEAHHREAHFILQRSNELHIKKEERNLDHSCLKSQDINRLLICKDVEPEKETNEFRGLRRGLLLSFRPQDN